MLCLNFSCLSIYFRAIRFFFPARPHTVLDVLNITPMKAAAGTSRVEPTKGGRVMTEYLN